MRFLAGCQADPVIEKRIDAYMEKIVQPGFYLESVDAAVFLDTDKKSLCIAVDEGAGPLRVIKFRNFCKELLSTNQGQVAPADGGLDRSLPSNCCLVACNAIFDPSGPQNHWVPAFFKEQMSNEEFWDITVAGKSDVSTHLRKVKKQILELEEKKERAADEEKKLLLDSEISELSTEVKQLLGQHLFEFPVVSYLKSSFPVDPCVMPSLAFNCLPFFRVYKFGRAEGYHSLVCRSKRF